MSDVSDGVGTCDNCGRTVRLVVPPNDPYSRYWYHLHSEMIWCHDGTDVAPELRGLRADPWKHHKLRSRGWVPNGA